MDAGEVGGVEEGHGVYQKGCAAAVLLRECTLTLILKYLHLQAKMYEHPEYTYGQHSLNFQLFVSILSFHRLYAKNY